MKPNVKKVSDRPITYHQDFKIIAIKESLEGKSVVVNTLGYDPIWFGVIIVLVAGMGVITQPVGVNVFIMKGQWLLFIFRHEIAYVSDSF